MAYQASREIVRGQVDRGIWAATAMTVAVSAWAPGTGHATEVTGPSDAVAELTAKRTGYSTTWRTADGGKVTWVESSPTRWRDGGGRWHGYDFMLRAGDDGGYRASIGVAAQTDLPARLDESADGGALVATPDGAVRMWLEGAAGDGAARDEVVTYPHALPGVTVALRASTSGLKEDLVLADASAASSFSYRLRLSDGLSARLTRAGTVAIAEGATVRFEIPAPVATDANEYPRAAPVPVYRLRALGDGDYRLSFEVDRDWLDAPERAWPVTVDPTIGVVKAIPQASTCVNRMTVTAVSSPQQTVARSTLCDDPNGAFARIGAERTVQNGATYTYAETNAAISFPSVEEVLRAGESFDGATLTLWKEADGEAGNMTGLRVLGKSGEYNDDPASTVRTGYQVPGGSFDVDVTPIVAAWAANLADPTRGFAQQALWITEDAVSNFWVQGASWPGVEYCWLWLMSSTCPRWGSWIGTSTSPVVSKRPVLELRTTVVDGPAPRLVLDSTRSWAGQVFVVNDSDAWFEPDRITFAGGTGGLGWAAGGTADRCTGVAMAPGRSCWIRVTGDGTVRFADGRQAAFLTIATSSLPRTPPSSVGPDGPRLEAAVAGDVATIANAGPTATATISQVSFVSGDLAWRSSQADDLCTGVTLALNDGTCELRLRGTTGVVRFVLDGGVERDLTLTLNPPVQTDLAPTLTVSKPAADLNANRTVSLAPPTRVVAGSTFSFSIQTTDERQIHAVTVDIDGRPAATLTGTTYRGCATGSAYYCLPACVVTPGDNPITPCTSWYWGDRTKVLSRPLVLNTPRLADGRHLLSVTVRDGAGSPSQPVHAVTREWEITVDNDGPAALADGPLFEQRGRDRLLGPLTLNLIADSPADGGVVRMRLIDETGTTTRALADFSRTCGQRCDVTAAFARLDLTSTSWTEGVHRLSLETTRVNGRTAIAQAWTVDYYAAARDYGGLDDPGDFAQLASDLWSRTDRAAVWNRLRQADKDRVLVDLRGRLIRESDEGLPYYVDPDGQRHLVSSTSHFNLSSSQILVLPDGALSSLPRGPAITANTRLYRTVGQPSVYYMSAVTLRRHGVTSPAVAAAWELNLGTTEETPVGFLSLVAQGADITMSYGAGIPYPRPANRTLVRDYSDPAVYFISGGTRYWMSSLLVFGLSNPMVRVVPDGTVGQLPAGANVPSSGKLFRGSDDPAVYYIDNGIRYWVTSSGVAVYLRLDLSTTSLLPPGLIDLVQRGPDLTVGGGANGIIDSPEEVWSLAAAMAATSTTGRQDLWAGLGSGSRAYFVDSLLADAREAREAFGLSSDETTVRARLADPSAQGSIAEFGFPMTPAEDSYISQAPSGFTYLGPPAPDALAPAGSSTGTEGDASDTPEPTPDELAEEPGPDSTTGAGCDPSTEPHCANGSLSSEAAPGGYTPQSLPTDDLDAIEARRARALAAAAGGVSDWRFNRYGARADAWAHGDPGTSRTGRFGRFGDTDCTNFVSQVWHLGGGLSMKKEWWIHKFPPGYPTFGVRRQTASWISVRNFVDLMVNQYGIANFIETTESSAYLPRGTGLGDAVEYDWGAGHGWSHLAVVVRLTGTNHKIAQHSRDRREGSWRRGWNEASAAARRRFRARVVHVKIV